MGQGRVSPAHGHSADKAACLTLSLSDNGIDAECQLYSLDSGSSVNQRYLSNSLCFCYCQRFSSILTVTGDLPTLVPLLVLHSLHNIAPGAITTVTLLVGH